MTKKDYELIAVTFANRVAELKSNYSEETADDRISELQIVAIDLAVAFMDTNVRFDRARFVEACNLA